MVVTFASIAAKPAPAPRGIHKITHVVVIMQENRSFDEYFGTFPGADGIPRRRLYPRPGSWGLRQAVPRPVGAEFGRAAQREECYRGHQRRQDGRLRRTGGIRSKRLRRSEQSQLRRGRDRRGDGIQDGCGHPELLGLREELRVAGPDVRAQPAWSLPAHLFMVSGWSARCSQPLVPGDLHERSHRSRPRTTTRTRPTMAGPISPTSCTGATSRGATTSPRERNLTATTAQSPAPQSRRTSGRPKPGTRCPTSSPSTRTASSATSGPHRVSSLQPAAAPARRLLGRPRPQIQRPPAETPGQRRPVLGDEPDQRDHARPELEEHCDLPRLGRLGRLLRPRRPADDRRERLRAARSRPW